LIGKTDRKIGKHTSKRHMMKHTPLYLRVKEQLHEELEAMRRPGGQPRLPTLDALQAQYGVSRPTLSKAIASLAAEGFLVKEAGRGTFALPPAAPGGGGGLPRLTIGFIAPLSDAELPQTAFRGIDRAASRSDCRVLMAGARDSVAQENTAACEMIAAGARGLIIYPTVRQGESGEGDYLGREDLGVPVVLLDTCTPAQGHAQIVFDNRRAGADMTRWLQAHGHRRIGLILYREEVHHPALEARYQGYQDALRDAGRALDSDLVRRVPPAEQHAALEAALTGLLALPEPPTAMIASNDLMAVEIIEILSSRGIPVPAGVAVAGFDNLAVARRYRPAFPTTAPDFEQMGEIACQTLLDSLAAGTRPVQTYILPVPLLIRSYPARHMPDTDHKAKTDGALHHLSVTA